VLPYWYIFFLDKTHWNNHSYLFGLIGIILTLTDSDKSFAISATNEEIPAWNYHIIRLQIFILYFYAGIKKTEVDWLTGYSMSNLRIVFINLNCFSKKVKYNIIAILLIITC
jgi:vitamin K-dependent gamma-carboxylase